MTEYGVLHYAGDVTAADQVQPGMLLGTNELGVPWEVLDAEFDGQRTTVQLQTATPDAIRAGVARVQEVVDTQLPAVQRVRALFGR